MTSLLRGLTLSGAVLLSSACVPTRDGQLSELSAEAVTIHNGFAPVPVPRAPGEYHAVTCVYSSSSGLTGIGPSFDKTKITIVKVPGDRLFVTLDGGKLTSGALIDKKGKEYDFNLNTDPKKGFMLSGIPVNMTKENYDAIAEEHNKHTMKLIDPHVVNPMTLTVPDFSDAPFEPGKIVAHIKQEGDENWADLYYRGTVAYLHKDSVPLFDIVRIDATGHKVLRGFVLWDNEHWVPLLWRFNIGLMTVKSTQDSCHSP